MPSPLYILMSINLLISILILFSSNSMFSMWLALEILTISFITLMFTKNNQEIAEGCMIYFLPQALSSSMFIFLLAFPSILIYTKMFFSIMIISMAIKLGMAPFHQWFPIVAKKCPLNINIILMTIMKLPPFIILSSSFLATPLSIILILSSAIIGSLGGFNQNNLKALMAFSSISHMAWIYISLSNEKNIWLIYLILYSMIITSIFFILMPNTFLLNQMFSKNFVYKNLVVFLLLSLSGLPPLTGFFQKWLVISLNINSPMILILIGSSIINIMFYLRLTYPFLLSFSLKSYWLSDSKLSPMKFILALKSVFLLPFALLLYTLFV
uniref:NADH-ubiquinone oxidoreductase chain 2 n=1 Tax=Phrynus sp. 1 SEM-2008 TaxID=507471 RepID=B2CKD3_9ARAC|nr:NADH dehydrogenase subunit 2 [Phrynus sp. 1 SEM-2008]